MSAPQPREWQGMPDCHDHPTPTEAGPRSDWQSSNGTVGRVRFKPNAAPNEQRTSITSCLSQWAAHGSIQVTYEQPVERATSAESVKQDHDAGSQRSPISPQS